MNKAILVIDMPSCCYKCFALDDSGDYPVCILTGEQRGYNFRSRERKMDRCPLREVPSHLLCFGEETDYIEGYNDCLNEILGT
jgi:hypothetical protein